MAKQHVTTTVNNDEFEFLCEPKASMLDVLRDELNLTGSKDGFAVWHLYAGRIGCSKSFIGKEPRPNRNRSSLLVSWQLMPVYGV